MSDTFLDLLDAYAESDEPIMIFPYVDEEGELCFDVFEPGQDPEEDDPALICWFPALDEDELPDEWSRSTQVHSSTEQPLGKESEDNAVCTIVTACQEPGCDKVLGCACSPTY